MYKKIRSHPTTLEIYGKKLISQGLISQQDFDERKNKLKDFLNTEFKNAKSFKQKMTWFDGVWSRFKPEIGKDKRGKTGVEKKELINVGKKITEVPNNFNIHKTLLKILENKRKMFTDDKPIDWSTAELLAFGTLLNEGFSVRLSGQDSGRGTFSQRHAVFRDQDSHDRFVPLHNISKKQKSFEVIDSLLSELGVLGFEFGYFIRA